MKILYIVPGVMSMTDLGAKELERRKNILQGWADTEIEIEITDIMSGPMSIESAYEEYLSIPETVSRIVDAEKKGLAGIILGCFGDPGIDAAREMVKIPIVGPGESSMFFASLLGQRFSIVTVMSSVVPSLKKRARLAGMESRLASILPTGIPVLELPKDLEKTKRTILERSEQAIRRDGADVIILGCMSMAFLGISDEIQDILEIPVVNPALVALKVLETMIGANLTHSKKAYPTPPKMHFPGQ